MNYPPDPSEQVILKTAQAALRGYAAAFTSRFQSQQAVPAEAGTSSAPLQSPAMSTGQTRFCSLCGTSTVSNTRAVTVALGRLSPADCVQETIRLTGRPPRSLLKHAGRNTPVPGSNALIKRTTGPETSRLYGRLLSDTSIAENSSLRGKSASTVTAEEYCIRRVTRQRVFHEKGNAD